MKPFCIGKSKNPRCLHHVNRNTLPLSYDASRNAWMTSTLFDTWFHQEFVPAVRRHLRQQRLPQKALLLLDNCPAHPPADSLISRDRKIRVSYLPKNTTSKIQPLDQGIISTFKMHYRRELVRKIVAAEIPVQDSLKAVNVKEMMILAGKSWECVTATCIERCWMKGLGPAFPQPQPDNADADARPDDQTDDQSDDDDEDEFEGFTAADIEEMRKKIDAAPEEIKQWLTIDNDCPIFEHASDSEIIANVIGTSSADTISNDAEDEDDSVACEPPPKDAEVINGLECALKWFETQDVDYMKVLQMRNLLDYARSKRESGMKQLKVDQFFKRS